MLSYQHVSKVYPGGVQALVDFNLEVKRGEFVVLIGPSGSGKTTALKMVNRLIDPTEGTILLNGQDIRAMNPYTLRHQIGYALQGIGLFPHLTVAEIIAIVPEVLGWPAARRRERVDELLELAGLDPAEYRNRYPHELSGGQQQRVGVLRALAADPPLILMDEPFGALDPITRADLQDELQRLQQAVQKTILFVTHDIQEALRLADRIVIMRDGQIAQVGSPQHLVERPADRFVANFVRRAQVSLRPEPLELAPFIEPAPPVVPHATPVAEALALMEKQGVTELVVQDSRRILGVVRRATLLLKVNANRTVGEVLGRPLPTLHPDELVHVAVAQMNRLGVLGLPVADKGQLVGVVHVDQLAGAMVAHVWGDDSLAGETAD